MLKKRARVAWTAWDRLEQFSRPLAPAAAFRERRARCRPEPYDGILKLDSQLQRKAKATAQQHAEAQREPDRAARPSSV